MARRGLFIWINRGIKTLIKHLLFVLWVPVILTWDPVTKDVYGNPITISHYRVYRKYHARGFKWPKTPMRETQGTKVKIELLPTGYAYDFAVTAVGGPENLESERSNVIKVSTFELMRKP
jgi:hypothetical protein